jgi:hypothetical protein
LIVFQIVTQIPCIQKVLYFLEGVIYFEKVRTFKVVEIVKEKEFLVILASLRPPPPFPHLLN